MIEIRRSGVAIEDVVMKQGYAYLEQMDDDCWDLVLDDGKRRVVLSLWSTKPIRVTEQ